MAIDNNRWQSISINIIDCYQPITYSVKHFNCQFHRVLIELHILISLLFIWEFRTEDRGGCGRQHKQTYKERRRKRNNNKLNRVWTTTASQVSWIFAMNSKLNRSSLYYWQQDMLIVLIICAVFHRATSMNNSQTLLLRFKIIYDLHTLPRYLKIRRHEFCASRWSLRPPKCDYRLIIDWPMPINANQQ